LCVATSVFALVATRHGNTNFNSGYWGFALFWDINSTHIVCPDTRDINAYVTLVDLVYKHKYFEDAETNYGKGGLYYKYIANELLEKGLFQLGLATHPLQDKHGHSDYYQTQKNWPFSEAYQVGKDEDDVTHTYSIGLIEYEHFDDVIKSRDETYNVLGRFYKKYKTTIDKR